MVFSSFNSFSEEQYILQYHRLRVGINIFPLGYGYENSEFLPTQTKLSQDRSLILFISKRKFSGMSLIRINLMWNSTCLSFITPVINTIGATWKILFPSDQHHVTTKAEQALPYPICPLKGIQCKLQSGTFSTLAWLMPYVRLMLKIYKGWYTWFITPEMFCPSNSWNLGTCFTTLPSTLLGVTACSTIATLLSFYLQYKAYKSNHMTLYWRSF